MRLTEMAPSAAGLCVRGPGGSYVHEFVVPVARVPQHAQPSREVLSTEKPPSGDGRNRRFAPGGPWMYVKIYCSVAETDRILRRIVAPVIEDARRAGVLERWFFIRYADPDHHIRLRLRGVAAALHSDVLAAIHATTESWLASGGISRIQVDTYQPEVERYGGVHGLDLSEQLFEADSESVIAALERQAADAEGDVHARWRAALAGLDTMLNDLSSSQDERRTTIERRRAAYRAEFNVDTASRHALGDRFRELRLDLENVLQRDPSNGDAAEWSRRSSRLRPLVEQLRLAEARHQLDVSFESLVDSYLHMYVNRMVRAQGRVYELVMFEFLGRYIESVDARSHAGK